MSSVIPARLQFQCGHAALVTLPRVKGESATQRNVRVAREKTAALARQCDFCAPAVAVLEPQGAAVNGNYSEVGLSDVVEPTSVSELSVVVTNESEMMPSEPAQTPPPADVEVAIVPAELVIAEVLESEQGEVEVLEEVVAEAIIETLVEEAPTPEPKPARQPRARRQRRTPAAPTRPARARRAPARRATPRPATPSLPVASGQRFVVEYQVERVVRATDIQEVLRQLEGLGATDVIAVTRED